MQKAQINIAGDLYLGRRLQKPALEQPASLFDDYIGRLFKSADLNIVNLESPLTMAGPESEIVKTGPPLKAPPAAVKVLTELHVGLVTLGNNHIYDFGEKGLSDTLSVCRSNNIATVGAGMNLKEASLAFTTTIAGLRIAVINFAENEWANANAQHGGANPMDLVQNTRAIRSAAANADHVIVIVHGGHEYYRYPSPRMVDQYRFYAEQGASAVICHHAHCYSGYEVYNGVPIFYGLGNFLFDGENVTPGWYTGFVVSLMPAQGKTMEWKLFPYVQSRENLRVEQMNATEEKAFFEDIDAINRVIADPARLTEAFNGYVMEQQKQVMAMLSTSYVFGNKYVRSAIRKLGMERFFMRRAQLKSILNYSRCEAHRDVTISVLHNYFKTK